MAAAGEPEDTAEEARARMLEGKFATISARKFSLVKCDMEDDDMVKNAIVSANSALDLGGKEDAMADAMKKGFDGKYGPLWHCVIGNKYGAEEKARCLYKDDDHEKGRFIYFLIGNSAVLLFKSKED